MFRDVTMPYIKGGCSLGLQSAYSAISVSFGMSIVVMQLVLRGLVSRDSFRLTYIRTLRACRPPYNGPARLLLVRLFWARHSGLWTRRAPPHGLIRRATPCDLGQAPDEMWRRYHGLHAQGRPALCSGPSRSCRSICGLHDCRGFSIRSSLEVAYICTDCDMEGIYPAPRSTCSGDLLGISKSARGAIKDRLSSPWPSAKLPPCRLRWKSLFRH